MCTASLFVGKIVIKYTHDIYAVKVDQTSMIWKLYKLFIEVL